MSSRVLFGLLCSSLLSLAACGGGGGVAGIRLDVAEDMSATVVLRTLGVPDMALPIESETQGVEWVHRAVLSASRGHVAQVSKLAVSDLRFEAGDTEAGFRYLKVTVPCRAGAKWPMLFAPAPEQRRDVTATFDPEGAFPGATTHVGLVVHVPGRVVSQGVEPTGSGVAPSADQSSATLDLTLDRVLAAGNDVVWLITWR